MRILPPVQIDTVSHLIPMADRTAIWLLVNVLSEEGIPTEPAKLGPVFFQDPPFATWLILQYFNHEKHLPTSFDALCEWLRNNRATVLRWRPNDPYRPPALVQESAAQVGLKVTAWVEQHRALLVALTATAETSGPPKEPYQKSPLAERDATSPDRCDEFPSGGNSVRISEDCCHRDHGDMHEPLPRRAAASPWLSFVAEVLANLHQWSIGIAPSGIGAFDHNRTADQIPYSWKSCCRQGSTDTSERLDPREGEHETITFGTIPTRGPQVNVPVFLSVPPLRTEAVAEPAVGSPLPKAVTPKTSDPDHKTNSRDIDLKPSPWERHGSAWDLESAGDSAFSEIVSTVVDLLPLASEKIAKWIEYQHSFQLSLERAKIKALAEFSAGASHELNNPLAIISGRAQLLLKDEADLNRRRDLATIVAQAQRAHEMLADLRLFAQPPQPQFRRIDLVDFVRRLVDEFQEEILCRQIRLVFEAPFHPVFCEADTVQLTVAIRAILDNAVEAIGRDGLIMVRVNSCQDIVVLNIIDNGSGIPAEARSQIFTPFFSGRQAGRGLGFGLCKAWRIIQNHNGDLRVESIPGHGTSVALRLPLSQGNIRPTCNSQESA